MENSFTPYVLVYKEVCLEGSYLGSWEQPHFQRLLFVMPVGRKPSRGSSAQADDSGLCTPLLTTHCLKLVTWPQHRGEGPEVPFPPCQAEPALCSGQPHDNHTRANLNPPPCFLEPFLPALPLPDRVDPPCSKAPEVHASIALPSRGFVKWMRISVSSWPVRTSRTQASYPQVLNSAQHIRCLINEVFME